MEKEYAGYRVKLVSEPAMHQNCLLLINIFESVDYQSHILKPSSGPNAEGSDTTQHHSSTVARPYIPFPIYFVLTNLCAKLWDVDHVAQRAANPEAAKAMAAAVPVAVTG